MTTLRVVLDEALGAPTATASRIARATGRALVATAPTGSGVRGLLAASPEPDYARLETLVPGLVGLEKHALARRELRAAWAHGLALPRRGPVHAPGLLAPMRRHDRLHEPDDHVVVTIADLGAWTHPELVPTGSWIRRMAARAERFADAVIAPTHAIADALRGRLALGDRVLVVPPADPGPLPLPTDPDAVAERLALPERFVLAVAPDAVGRARAEAAVALLDDPIPLVVAQTDAEDELGLLVDRADAVLAVDAIDGWSPVLLDAWRAGTPVVATAAPSRVEVLGEAVDAIPTDDEGEVPRAIATEIGRLLGDPAAAERAAVLGADRARAFDGLDAARRLWELHAAL